MTYQITRLMIIGHICFLTIKSWLPDSYPVGGMQGTPMVSEQQRSDSEDNIVFVTNI